MNWIWYSLSKLWISSVYSGVDAWFSCVLQQYYRKARQIAVARGYPDLAGKEEEILQSKKFMYPRPASAPSSPSNSRSTTPAPSEHGDDDEEDDIDEDEENAELNSNPEADRPTFKWRKGRNSLLLRVQTDLFGDLLYVMGSFIFSVNKCGQMSWPHFTSFYLFWFCLVVWNNQILLSC